MFFNKKRIAECMFVLMCLCSFPHFIHSQNLSDFLNLSAVEISEESIRKDIRFYLNRTVKKGKIEWFDGAIVTNTGERYDDIKLKFNTIDHSVNIMQKGKVYRVSQSKTGSFYLFGKNGIREFRKGFSENELQTITASCNVDALIVMNYLTAYEKIDLVQILNLEIDIKEKGTGRFLIEFLSNDLSAAIEMRSYLYQSDNFWDIELNVTSSGLKGNVFFEKLVANKGIYFLKYYSKKTVESENIALIKNKSVVTYDKYEYYISNLEEAISRVYPTKKYVKKALIFAGVKVPRRIPSVSNEKKLVAFFKKVI